MATRSRSEILEVAGRAVTVSNPDKVMFPAAGYTKLDLVRYYVAVADGALRGVGGRPMALKRYVNGAADEFFFQKRAPESRPDWIETVELAFPSGRTADEIVVRDAAQLAWIINLACIDLNPHPVRGDDLDHPDELRIDLDPVPGVGWPQLRAVAALTRAVLEDHGLVGWPKTSGSRGIHVYARIERRWGFGELRHAALAVAREVERRAPELATSRWWKEERHGVFLDYNQNAKDRTVASVYSVRPTPDARVSTPLDWEELAVSDPADYTLATVPRRFLERGDPWEPMDSAVGSLDRLLELSARQLAEHGEAPLPPHYAKEKGEPPRVQPSKRRPARAPAAAGRDGAAATGDGRGSGDVAPDRGAVSGGGAAAAGDGAVAPRGRKRAQPVPRPPSQSPRQRMRPTGVRTSTRPLVVVGQAQAKEDALAGLDRWKARHPAAVPHLAPHDVLVDAMRGRSTTWWRVRVNLERVPPAERPAQEALDPDFDPHDAR